MTTSGDTTAVEATDLLPLPDLLDLSEEQARGAICVWCDEPLATPSVVDLGPRRIPLSDGRISVFPRACPACTGVKAQEAAEHHAATCELCVDNVPACDTARALRRLVLEYGR
ncbi:hypothetical protein ACH40E_02795 [Streptomyces acidicola]|uniref:hypothetical protein n=1 Tax=Streptomyces acidicola TaxID=2596892 RepID=UPI0037A9DF32